MTNRKSSFAEQENFTLLGKSFNGTAKIESSQDVAFLFRNLESVGVENVFLVLVNADGSYSVVFVSTGSENASYFPMREIMGAIITQKPASVYFVHNHPGGTLEASYGDFNAYNSLYRAMAQLTPDIKLNDSVIIDTDKGQYATFNNNNKSTVETKQGRKAVYTPKIFTFSILEYFKKHRKTINGSADVAKFLSAHKRGLISKNHLLVLNSQNEVTKYVILPPYENAEELAVAIAGEVSGYGTACILATNDATSENVDVIIKAANMLQKINIRFVAEQVKEDAGIITHYQNIISEEQALYNLQAQQDLEVREDVVDITENFENLKGKSAQEKKEAIDNALNKLVGAEIETQDNNIIGIKEPQITHAKNKSLHKNKSKAQKKDIAAYQKIESIIKAAVLDRAEPVKTEHNKDLKTINYKMQEVKDTQFFQSFVKLGGDIFKVVIATHRLKSDENEKRSYLYEAYVEAAPYSVTKTPRGSDNIIQENTDFVNEENAPYQPLARSVNGQAISQALQSKNPLAALKTFVKIFTDIYNVSKKSNPNTQIQKMLRRCLIFYTK